MTFTLKKVIPWGRNFDEYQAMFNLKEEDLGKRFLGCSDGPASFNSTMHHRGGDVISVDPLYYFSADEIRNQVDEAHTDIMEQCRQHANEMVWTFFHSIEELEHIRKATTNEFLSDYDTGLREGRYINASLPNLPFEAQTFDIALCSNFLFCYSEHFSEDFHIRSIKELCRLAPEVRIFPLNEIGSQKSRYLDSVLEQLKGDGFTLNIQEVPYGFSQHNNKMLMIKTR